MRIAITGATGNIGTSVVRRLTEDGHSLVGLARRVPDRGAVGSPDVSWVSVDLTEVEPAQLAVAFAGVDAVVHLAWGFQPSHRLDLLRELRLGEYDVLVGINLLREGLDLPEVSLVAILDADKEGFLRSEISLIQTIGRAARHVKGKAILYADKVTDSMRRALFETSRRRETQAEFNKEHGITPQSIIKAIESTLVTASEADYFKVAFDVDSIEEYAPEHLAETIERVEREMRAAAAQLDFERAAGLRDKIKTLRERQLELA